jgi:hypothetical protein
MTMRRVMFACLVFALSASLALAFYTANPAPAESTSRSSESYGNLDEQCTIDYYAQLYSASGGAGGSGTVGAPGSFLNSNYGAFKFTNSCHPGDSLIAYCVDLAHSLNQGAYCANINPAVVNPTYPEQYKAMAYVMTWFDVTGALTDDILQLALWKLSNYEGSAGAGRPAPGMPLYRFNGGRGFPDTTNIPVYPYVNTVWGSNVVRNDSANFLCRYALGAVDGLAKNVSFCDDILNPEVGVPTVHNGISTVPVTIHLARGAQAAAAGNNTVGGVRFHITTSIGVLSTADMFTDATGSFTFTISQPYGTTTPSQIRVCSKGGWPKRIEQCTGNSYQDLIQKLQATDVCDLCLDVPVLPDNFLNAELRAFDAVAGDRQITLNWTTASEQNNESFKIVRNSQVVHVEAGLNAASGAQYSWIESDLENGTTYNYQLIAVDGSGEDRVLATTFATPSVRAGVSNDYALEQNYPNPFNPETAIAYSLPDAANIRLSVFDITGREIAVLVNGYTEAGRHNVNFRADNLPTGVYFYKLAGNGFSVTKKMILLK